MVRPLEPSPELSGLLARQSYRKGSFTLASGKRSNFYVDVKRTAFEARGAALLGRLLLARLRAHAIECVGGMAVGAVPLVTAALVEARHEAYPLSGFFVRRAIKDHGTARRIDGCFDARSKVALLEDVVTTGASTLEAVEAVEAAGGRVELVVAVVDREEDGGLAALSERVGRAEALTTRTSILLAHEAAP